MTTYAKKIVTGIILILLLIGGYYYFKQPTEVVENTIPATDSTAAEDTSSLLGCYIAHLSKDVYTLKIDTQHGAAVSGMLSFNNFEKDSSSGSFTGTFTGNVLLGMYAFDSEGMHSVRQVVFKKDGDNFIEGFGSTKTEGDAELFEDVSTVTYDANSTFVKSDTCAEHFASAKGTVVFDYSPLFKTIAGSTTTTVDWKLDSKQKGTLFSRTIINKSYIPKTNFSNATLTIGRSSDATVVKSCVVPTSNETKSAVTMISGHPFTAFTTSDAGAGNFYDTTSYRSVIKGNCYAIETTIHSTNIGNYSPDQGITEFNKSSVITEFEKIIKSVSITA